MRKQIDGYPNYLIDENGNVFSAIICVELGRVFNSMSEAAEITGANRSNISAVCRGRLNKTGGYHWRYAEESDLNG